MELLPVPYLRSGMGVSPSDGGCLMQVADWVSSGHWSDRPECVNSWLAGYAIWANDSSHDHERQKLLKLLPRLLHTRQFTPEEEPQARRLFEERFDASVESGLTCYETLERMIDVYDEFTGRDLSVQPEAPDLSALCVLQAH